MDTLFKISYPRNRELAKDLYGYYYFRRPLAIVAHILLAISVLLAAYNIIFFGWDYNYILLILLSLLVLLRIPLYFKQVNAFMDRDQELFGSEVVITVSVMEQYIENTPSVGVATQLKYENIKRGTVTKNLILLRTKSNLGYVLPKNAFIQGTAEDFILFLRNKGIKIK